MNKSLKLVKSNFLKNIILLIITLSLIYITGEVLFRYYFYNQLGYRLDKMEYLHNSEGFRDYEHNLEKPNQTVRILVLGDSFTYGQGVKDNAEIYTSLLEKMLNEQQGGLRYEIINFGLPGADELMKISLLKEKGLKYKPHIVIFQHRLWYGNNSLMRKYGLYDPIYAWAIKHKAYFLQWLNSKIRTTLFQEKRVQGSKDYISIMYGPNSGNIKILEEHFELLNNMSIENKFTVLCINLVWIDSPNNWSQCYNHQKFSYDFIKDTCEENNFYFLDPQNYYWDYKPKELRISSLDSHPNKKGHKVISEAIYDFLIDKGMVTGFRVEP